MNNWICGGTFSGDDADAILEAIDERNDPCYEGPDEMKEGTTAVAPGTPGMCARCGYPGVLCVCGLAIL